jgi:hypothetical protein
MKRIIAFAAGRPLLVASLLLLLTLLASLQAPKIQISFSADVLIPSHGALWDAYDETVRTFGATDTVIVVVSDARLFTPKVLTQVRQVVDGLAAIPYVEGIVSLFSLKHGSLDADETVRFTPYLAKIPQTLASAEAIREEALADPFVVGNLLSKDGHSMAINLSLRPDESGGRRDRQITNAIDQAIAPLRGQVDEVFALGRPQVGDYISNLIVHDQLSILPISLIALILTLWVMLGRWQGVVLPLMTAAMSVVWTLAFMATFGLELNVVTSVVPLLLVVVGSTEDIHLLAAYFNATRNGTRPKTATFAMASTTALAVLLTFTTTYLGFLSITLNEIELLRQFGLVASTGLLFNFVVTVLGVPALLALTGDAQKHEKPPPVARYRSMATSFYRVTERHRTAILFATALLLTLGAIGATGLRVNNDYMDYLPGDAPISEQAQSLHRELAGIEQFDLVVSGEIEGTFEHVRYLREIEKLQAFLDNSGFFDKTQSFADIVKEAYRVMEGMPPGELELPDNDDIVRELLLFLGGDFLDSYVNRDLSATRISVRHGITASKELARATAAIEAFAHTNVDPGLEVRLTGKSILAQHAADSLAAGQAESLLLVVVVIFLIIAALFVNPKAGLLAVILNLLPIVILFGIMGFTGIALNTGTVMVAAVAIGISVDNTMHFMVRYHREMARHSSTTAAILATMEQVACPIMATSVALMLGFGALAFSSFPPVVYFGLLGAIVFVLALAATFLITPILLEQVRLVTLWDLLSVQIKARLMERCTLFRGMRYFQVRRLIAMCSRQRYETGEYIIHQGMESDELFVILDGRAQAQRRDESGRIEALSTQSIGDVIGEIALVTELARTADVVALETTDVLILHWKDMQALARYMPHTASRLLMNISADMGRRFVARGL